MSVGLAGEEPEEEADHREEGLPEGVGLKELQAARKRIVATTCTSGSDPQTKLGAIWLTTTLFAYGKNKASRKLLLMRDRQSVQGR